jgi:hypothetical protein
MRFFIPLFERWKTSWMTTNSDFLFCIKTGSVRFSGLHKNCVPKNTWNNKSIDGGAISSLSFCKFDNEMNRNFSVSAF